MIIQQKKQINHQTTGKDMDYRERHEIARVLLAGNAEIIIYCDKPGHLLFGLFNPLPRTDEN